MDEPVGRFRGRLVVHDPQQPFYMSRCCADDDFELPTDVRVIECPGVEEACRTAAVLNAGVPIVVKDESTPH